MGCVTVKNQNCTLAETFVVSSFPFLTCLLFHLSSLTAIFPSLSDLSTVSFRLLCSCIRNCFRNYPRDDTHNVANMMLVQIRKKGREKDQRKGPRHSFSFLKLEAKLLCFPN